MAQQLRRGCATSHAAVLGERKGTVRGLAAEMTLSRCTPATLGESVTARPCRQGHAHQEQPALDSSPHTDLRIQDARLRNSCIAAPAGGCGKAAVRIDPDQAVCKSPISCGLRRKQGVRWVGLLGIVAGYGRRRPAMRSPCVLLNAIRADMAHIRGSLTAPNALGVSEAARWTRSQTFHSSGMNWPRPQGHLVSAAFQPPSLGCGRCSWSGTAPCRPARTGCHGRPPPAVRLRPAIW